MTDMLKHTVDESNACDGFRVVETIRGNRYWMHLAYYQDGEMQDVPTWDTDLTRGILLWKENDPTPRQLGEAKRIKMFVEAMCRFLNSGGVWVEMELFLDMCRTKTAETAVSFQRLGFHLLDTYISSEGRNEHVFASSDDRNVIRWVEDGFIDLLPAHAYLEEESQEDTEAYIDGQYGDTRRPRGEEGEPRQLSGKEDHGDERRDRTRGKVPPPGDDARG
jgi:hypothetical protein